MNMASGELEMIVREKFKYIRMSISQMSQNPKPQKTPIRLPSKTTYKTSW
jgi:hypothetical protein